MFVRLKEKPFYFITDRDTKYTFLVDNRGGAAKRHLYLPDQFETMTARQVREYRWGLASRLLWWGLRNQEKMTTTDSKIVRSKAADIGLTIITGLFGARFLRRVFFRIELPFLEMAFKNSSISLRWLQSFFAYSLSATATYQAVKTLIREEYLVDLALEYRYNFDKKLSCLECDGLLNELCSQRFGGRESKEKAG